MLSLIPSQTITINDNNYR